MESSDTNYLNRLEASKRISQDYAKIFHRDDVAKELSHGTPSSLKDKAVSGRALAQQYARILK